MTSFISSLLLFGLISFALSAAADPPCDNYGFTAVAPKPTPFEQSNLWSVRSPTGQTGLIFGVIHTSDGRIIGHYNDLMPLSYAADIYFSEVDFGPASVTRMSEAVVGANRLKELDPGLTQRYLDVVKKRGGNPESLVDKKDWYQWSELSRPLERGQAIDYIFWARRAASGRPSVALEQMDHLLHVLESYPRSLDVLKDIICEYENIEAQFTALKAAFAASDWPGFFAESNRWQSRQPGLSSSFSEQMVAGRNRHMLKTITQSLGDHKSFFVTVGLAHLAGEEGLMNLLAKQGFEIKPLTMTEVAALAKDVRANTVSAHSTTFKSVADWLTANTDLKMPAQSLPEFKIVSMAEMQKLACGNAFCQVQVYYSQGVVYINDVQFIALTNKDTGLLAHIARSLVHWLREVESGPADLCARWSDIDSESYYIQNQFLIAHGARIANRNFSPAPQNCQNP